MCGKQLSGLFYTLGENIVCEQDYKVTYVLAYVGVVIWSVKSYFIAYCEGKSYCYMVNLKFEKYQFNITLLRYRKKLRFFQYRMQKIVLSSLKYIKDLKFMHIESLYLF